MKAEVRFYTLNDGDAAPGQEQTFGFRCPRNAKGGRCEGLIIKGRTNLKHDPAGKNGGIAQWTWDGNRESPTFAPSINCGGCKWHGFLEKGVLVDCAHKPEPQL